MVRIDGDGAVKHTQNVLRTDWLSDSLVLLQFVNLRTYATCDLQDLVDTLATGPALTVVYNQLTELSIVARLSVRSDGRRPPSTRPRTGHWPGSVAHPVPAAR